MWMKNSERKIRIRSAAAAALAVVMSCLCFPLTAHAAANVAEVTWKGQTKSVTAMDDAWNEAIYAAVNDQPATIKLLADWNPTRPYVLTAAQDFTIDLNGCRIDRAAHGKMSDKGNVFTVRGTLTITDSRPDAANYSDGIRGGVITGGAGDDVGGCIVVNGILNMNGGSIVGCVTNYDGGAIYLAEGATANISGVGFYSNMTYDSIDSCNGGAIFADRGSHLTIEDCVFENNYSEDSGGAIYGDCGTISVRNTIFNGNKCLDDGGALYLDSSMAGDLNRGTDATVDGCILENNRSDGSGGAIYCNSDNVTMLLADRIRYNSSGANGGAVFVNGDNVCMIDTTVVSNTAGGFGGGVYVDSMYDLNIQGQDRICSNRRSGGANDNVFLSEGGFSSARIYDGGLTEGSLVGVGTKYDEAYSAVELISEYQTRYFESDATGRKLSFKVVQEEAQTEYLIASAVNRSGRLLVPLCVLAAFAAAAVLTAVLYRKRTKEGSADVR